MNKIRIPPSPFEGVDYGRELELARFSRVAYLDRDNVMNPDGRINPDHRHLFDEWLGPQRWRHLDTRDFNDSSGFVAHAFIKDEPDKRIVIAIRGSDNPADWVGPNVAVMRDGELLELAKSPIAPATDRTKSQMAWVQDKILTVLGNEDAWHPQFQQSLDFAKEIRDTYESRGYKIELSAHSLGGAHNQVLSHTFGWDGRSFDAPGAANIVASDGYRNWLSANGITPAQAPRFKPDPFDSGFLNYTVNNSVVSKMSGPHIGDKQSISSYVGREGVGSHVRYGLGLVGGGLNETPLLGTALKATGASRAASTVIGLAAHGSHHGVDALDRHDVHRIVAGFEKAARTGKLPTIGEHSERERQPLAHAGPTPKTFEGTPLERQQQAVRSLLDGPADGPLTRFLDATVRGDSEAFRQAARVLCDTPEAKAWLQAGQERLHALQQGLPAADHARQTQEQDLHQHARIAPVEQALAR